MFVCILPGKAVPEMTYTVSGGTLNPTHSLTYSVYKVLWHCVAALVWHTDNNTIIFNEMSYPNLQVRCKSHGLLCRCLCFGLWNYNSGCLQNRSSLTQEECVYMQLCILHWWWKVVSNSWWSNFFWSSLFMYEPFCSDAPLLHPPWLSFGLVWRTIFSTSCPTLMLCSVCTLVASWYAISLDIRYSVPIPCLHCVVWCWCSVVTREEGQVQIVWGDWQVTRRAVTRNHNPCNDRGVFDGLPTLRSCRLSRTCWLHQGYDGYCSLAVISALMLLVTDNKGHWTVKIVAQTNY